jgi:hypothetical protein
MLTYVQRIPARATQHARDSAHATPPHIPFLACNGFQRRDACPRCLRTLPSMQAIAPAVQYAEHSRACCLTCKGHMRMLPPLHTSWACWPFTHAIHVQPPPDPRESCARCLSCKWQTFIMHAIAHARPSRARHLKLGGLTPDINERTPHTSLTAGHLTYRRAVRTAYWA